METNWAAEDTRSAMDGNADSADGAGHGDKLTEYSLIKLEGVEDSKAATFYSGKKVAFVYRAKREVRGSKIRVIWGKVTRPHGMLKHDFQHGEQKNGCVLDTDGLIGNSGVVRAQFRHNLPPKSFGASVRVMLYPSSI
ncbi:60S ribosomal protein L35Ae [Trichophyton verrucosum HKI 0517]|uniref:60S ribosomal protein L35Ae n=1 Tax=Trichophyton verrucosum (strain HKI 0517) TaxID=663202 RepID=D4DI91_TRIVH|nr:60S ribosomal protein L35Ae [Trichophyton verrucosum HKI 0517]EFE38429.1 60S ribosomal protein L35Ae [Trichophyton verrucosum HKI 0517]